MATINGTNDRDRLIGTSLADSMYGLNGDDSLAGGGGADRLEGGNGNDELDGEDGNDKLYGNDGNDTLIGGVGNDRLLGHAGNDTLEGGAGTDVLHGGSGYDMMTGGAGNDTYIVGEAGDIVIEQAGEGNDVVRSSTSWTLGDNFEQLRLSGKADLSGTGNGLGNIIRGNGGSNLLAGAGGNDQLFGNAGSDTLDGGIGRDTLSGGAGDDEFLFRDGDFAGMTAADADRILDFNQLQGDTINLEDIDADVLSDRDQDFQFIGTDAFHNVAGELRYEVIDGNTFVQGDTNGDGAADFTIRLDGMLTLQVGDFVL